MKPTILFLLFLSFFSTYAQAQQINFPLIVSDGTPTGRDTLRFGLDPTASEGIDASLGEIELPPSPPSGVFDSRFVGTNLNPPPALGQGVKKDFRTGSTTFNGTKMHQIKYQPGSGTTITISWVLPQGVTGRIYDIITGSLVADTMINTGSILVSQPTVFTSLFMRINYVAIPSQPVLLTPLNGTSNLTVTPMLDWADVISATSYRLQISADSNFSTTIFNDSTLTSSQYQVLSGLLSNQSKYYWRVNAKNLAGVSAYSSKFNFTTIVTPPAVPTLLLPVNNAINIILPVVMDWSDVSGASTYRFQLAPSNSFSTLLYDDSTLISSQFNIPSGALTNNSQYFWRVRAKNTGGVSVYSSVFNFTTIVSAPTIPVLTSPANNAQLVQLNPLMKWDSISTASTYRIQISSDSTFTTTNTDTVTSLARYKVRNNGLTINVKYFWRVNAANVGGTSAYSTIFNFRTGTTDLSLNTTIIPKAFKLYNNYPNPFNPGTTIKFDIPKESFVSLKIFNILGKEIQTLTYSNLKEGQYEYYFNANNLSSGIYLIKFEADEYSGLQKIVLVK